MNTKQLKHDIKRHEGWSSTAYRDTRGYLTIGYGFLIDDEKPGAGISKSEGLMILNNRLQARITRLENELDIFKGLSEARQRALVNMSYQLGVNGLLNFKNMIAAMREGDYDTAAEEALNSRWANQTPNRAKEIAEMIRHGTD